MLQMAFLLTGLWERQAFPTAWVSKDRDRDSCRNRYIGALVTRLLDWQAFPTTLAIRDRDSCRNRYIGALGTKLLGVQWNVFLTFSIF